MFTGLGETLKKKNPAFSKGCIFASESSFSHPQLVNCTRLAELVKKGVVDQRDASPTCSVSQTPMGVPVPQAGRVCSAMKVCTSHTPKEKRF